MGLQAVLGSNAQGRALRRHLALFAVALWGSSASADPVLPEAYVPNEELVSTEPDMIDPEYSQARAQITWVDRDGRLWVANINRRTGRFVPTNGRGVLVDSEAMTTNNLVTVGNGPEWIYTASGEQIVYTRYLPNQPHSLDRARLALAIERPGGTWLPLTLDDRPRNGPYASRDPADPQPRVSYIDDGGNHYWRNVLEPGSETPIPGFAPQFFISTRFVQNQRAVLFQAPDAHGVTQVFRHWLDSGEQEQLTTDQGHESIQTAAWMWQAPELGGESVMATVANDNTELRIYRQLDADPERWSVAHTIRPPGGGTITSPEPITLRGRSYMFMSVAKPGAPTPTIVALASIDPERPLFRQVSPDDDSRFRMDPELFVTSDGTAYLYYNRFNPELLPSPLPSGFDVILCKKCSEGIWRSNIGLKGP